MFIPHTDSERIAMLRTIGINSIDELFCDIPEEFRYPKLNLPNSQSEMEVVDQLVNLAAKNTPVRDLVCFLGAGAYNHFIPAVVDHILRRSEFSTAYTPYQPEVSQGTLQAIFEYQTMIAALTGMDVSNASHYDGATACAEAAVMAFHNFREKRKKIIVSPAVNPQYRATLKTYMAGYDTVKVAGDEPNIDPLLDPIYLSREIDQDTALVLVQYPDFFGQIYDYTDLCRASHEAGALFAVAVNPIALGLLKPPGDFEADIVVGEGQPLGIPLSFGGPYLGIFATKKELVRKISGRLVGETIDQQGRRGYVLTLTAREQHIRREKATSNICTNQGLMALAATVYLSTLGKHGLRQVAELCYHKAHYTAEKLSQIPGYQLISPNPFFHEFILGCPKPVQEINTLLLQHGFLGGYDLGIDYPALNHHMLIAVTEKNSRQEIDTFVEIMGDINHE